jgi:hypothetical protein
MPHELTIAPRPRDRVAGPIEFVLAMTSRDMVAPACGTDRLEDFFASLMS